MAHEPWFDVFCKTALRSASRRELIGALAALVPSLLLGGSIASTAAKKKRRGNGKKHKRKRPGHLGQPRPGEDDCDAFLDDPGEQKNCKRDRKRCRAPNQFCIHAIDNDGDDDIRGYSCCTGGRECCITGCKDTSSDPEYCGAGCGAPCDEGENCVDGDCVCAGSNGAGASRVAGESFGSASENACGEDCPPGWSPCGLTCAPPGALCCSNQVICTGSNNVCCVTWDGRPFCGIRNC